MADGLRVGVIGAGWAGASHVHAYRQLPGVEVVALWSRTTSRAHALARTLDGPTVRVFDDWDQLITRGGCDIVSITTAPMLRSGPFLLALEQGCHVLVEKPMSVGVEEAERMVSAAETSAAITACSFNWRYAPAHRTARRMILGGDIGVVRGARTEWFARLPREFLLERPWSARMDITDGPLGEGLSHDIDKIRFLTGLEFAKITSVVTPVIMKQDGYVVDGGRSLHLAELSAGVLAQLGLSLTAGQDVWQLRIDGDEGSLIIPDAGATLFRQRYDDAEPVMVNIATGDRRGGSTAPASGADGSDNLLQQTWNELIAEFVAAVRDGHPFGVGRPPELPALSDGLRSAQVIAAARRSSDEGRSVDVR